jgi:hypothetical protein
MIQNLGAGNNTAAIRSVGASTDLESYLLIGQGSGFSEVLTPYSFIRGADGANIAINLASAGSVYVRLDYYLEVVATGLPVFS